MTVDELGRSLVILLPDDDGLPSGEIVVATAMGQVVLNKPYQATTVSMFETKPTNPSNGRLGITFLDDSQVRLTEHSELIIDEFIYDPDPSKSKMALH